jgi:hypothetical protein
MMSVFGVRNKDLESIGVSKGYYPIDTAHIGWPAEGDG